MNIAIITISKQVRYMSMLPTDRQHTEHWQRTVPLAGEKKTHILRSFEYDLDGLFVGPCAEENTGRHENEADKTWEDQRARHDGLARR